MSNRRDSPLWTSSAIAGSPFERLRAPVNLAEIVQRVIDEIGPEVEVRIRRYRIRVNAE